MKMDFKVEDINNIDIDADILISYEIGKLSLDDIFDYSDLPKKEEIFDSTLTVKQDEFKQITPSALEIKAFDIDSDILSAYKETNVIDDTLKQDKIRNTIIEVKLEPETDDIDITSKESKEFDTKLLKCDKKVNQQFPESRKCVDEETVDNIKKVKEENALDSDELSLEFNNLNLSDTEKDQSKSSEIRERGGPDKSRRHTSKRRAQGQYVRNRNSDSSQFNSQALLFLSGCHVEDRSQINQTVPYNQPLIPFNLPCDSLEEFGTTNCPDDNLSYGVASPDSGYATSPSSSFSSYCGTSSPPLLNTHNLDSLDIVDEQVLLESLAEVNVQEYPLPEINLSGTDNPEDCINNIVEFLKDEKIDFDLFNHKSQEDESSVFISPTLYKNCEKPAQPVTPSSSSNTLIIGESTKTRGLMCKPVEDKAKKELKASLDKTKLLDEQRKILRRIQEDETNKKEVKVIYVVEEPDTDKPKNQTNLHIAISKSNKEEIYSIVEIHKLYKKPFSDINIRDKSGKTALDYAVQQKMPLIIDYLKENTAKQSLDI